MEPQLPKRPPEITDRQLDVARLVAEGRTNPQIAAELDITLDGAKYHVTQLLTRLDLERREEIVEWYRATYPSTWSRARAWVSLPFASLVMPLTLGGVAAGVIATVVIAGRVLGGGGVAPEPSLAVDSAPAPAAIVVEQAPEVGPIEHDPARALPDEARLRLLISTDLRLSSLDTFRAVYGEPPDATLGRIRIPSIGVDAPLGARTVGSDGTMELPSGPSDLVWYDLSRWRGLGGRIGAGGNAVLAGYADYDGRVEYAMSRELALYLSAHAAAGDAVARLLTGAAAYRGPGVLFDLQLLELGSLIEVEVGGATFRYMVTWRRVITASDSPAWAEIWSADVERDSLTIVTTGGDFDFTARSDGDRIVIRAERIDGDELEMAAARISDELELIRFLVENGESIDPALLRDLTEVVTYFALRVEHADSGVYSERLVISYLLDVSEARELLDGVSVESGQELALAAALRAATEGVYAASLFIAGSN